MRAPASLLASSEESFASGPVSVFSSRLGKFKNDEAAYPRPLGDEGHGPITAVCKVRGERLVCTTAKNTRMLGELRTSKNLACCRSLFEAAEMGSA
jgi:hypothetical protein